MGSEDHSAIIISLKRKDRNWKEKISKTWEALLWGFRIA